MNGCIFGFSFITCILKLGSKHSSREDLTKTGNDLGGQEKRKKLDSNIASIFHFAVLLPIFRFTKDFGQFLFGSAYEERDIKVCNFVTFEFDLFEPKCLNWVLPKKGRKGVAWVIRWGWFLTLTVIPTTSALFKKKGLITTSTQIIETSVTFPNNPVQNYNHPDGHFQSTYI